MQNIISVTLQYSNKDWVNIVFEDGSIGSCSLENPMIKDWLAEGNTPLPPDPIPEPEPLTPQQKLEAAGLTVEELRELLGL